MFLVPPLAHPLVLKALPPRNFQAANGFSLLVPFGDGLEHNGGPISQREVRIHQLAEMPLLEGAAVRSLHWQFITMYDPGVTACNHAAFCWALAYSRNTAEVTSIQDSSQFLSRLGYAPVESKANIHSDSEFQAYVTL